MTRSGEQNEIDLGRIVDEINAVYANGGVNFVFIPGDIADDGSATAYEAVRQHLDRLMIPWCGIVGDHDVHEKSFENFRRYIAADLFSSFAVGPYRFLRLNAFSTPKPDSFTLDNEQLHWLEEELKQTVTLDQRAVLFLHCYPSDLKQDGDKLKQILQRYPVLLVDMGHTHYNELSNDGSLLYSATRSTGQIEEGPVGYSVITIDSDVVCWHFVELGSPSLVVITQPGDLRLQTDRTSQETLTTKVSVRAKIWSRRHVKKVSARVQNSQTSLTSDDGLLWQGNLDLCGLGEGAHDLHVTASETNGSQITSSVRLHVGPMPERKFSNIDHENAIGEWTERGLLGTQLGPNKNGKKW